MIIRNLLILLSLNFSCLSFYSQEKIELRGQTGFQKVLDKGIMVEVGARYLIHQRIALGINVAGHFPIGFDPMMRQDNCANNLNAFYYGLGGEYYFNKHKLQGYFGLNLYSTQYEYSCYNDEQNVPNWYDFNNTHIWIIPRIGLKYQLNEKWSAFTEFGYGFTMITTLNHHHVLKSTKNINVGAGITYKL